MNYTHDGLIQIKNIYKMFGMYFFKAEKKNILRTTSKNTCCGQCGNVKLIR